MEKEEELSDSSSFSIRRIWSENSKVIQNSNVIQSGKKSFPRGRPAYGKGGGIIRFLLLFHTPDLARNSNVILNSNVIQISSVRNRSPVGDIYQIVSYFQLSSPCSEFTVVQMSGLI